MIQNVMARGRVTPDRVTCAVVDAEGFRPPVNLDPDLGIYGVLKELSIEGYAYTVRVTPLADRSGYEWVVIQP